MLYQEFKIALAPTDPQARIDGDSPVRFGTEVSAGDTRASGLFEIAMTLREVDERNRLLGRGEVPPNELVRVGRELFSALFERNRQAGEALQQARSYSRDTGSGLRIRLVFDHSAPLLLPWELMHDGSGYLALDPSISVLRCIRTKRRPRVLPVVAPEARHALSCHLIPQKRIFVGELESSTSAFGLRRAGFEVQAERGITMDDFLRTFEGRQYSVFQFSGPGVFDISEIGKRIVGSGITQNAVDSFVKFARLVAPAHLVSLEAADTARLAYRLSLAGIPLIVANQFPADPQSAQRDFEFSRALLGALAEGYSIDRATTAARSELARSRPGMADFAAFVVLYSGQGDTLIAVDQPTEAQDASSVDPPPGAPSVAPGAFASGPGIGPGVSGAHPSAGGTFPPFAATSSDDGGDDAAPTPFDMLGGEAAGQADAPAAASAEDTGGLSDLRSYSQRLEEAGDPEAHSPWESQADAPTPFDVSAPEAAEPAAVAVEPVEAVGTAEPEPWGDVVDVEPVAEGEVVEGDVAPETLVAVAEIPAAELAAEGGEEPEPATLVTAVEAVEPAEGGGEAEAPAGEAEVVEAAEVDGHEETSTEEEAAEESAADQDPPEADAAGGEAPDEDKTDDAPAADASSDDADADAEEDPGELSIPIDLSGVQVMPDSSWADSLGAPADAEAPAEAAEAPTEAAEADAEAAAENDEEHTAPTVEMPAYAEESPNTARTVEMPAFGGEISPPVPDVPPLFAESDDSHESTDVAAGGPPASDPLPAFAEESTDVGAVAAWSATGLSVEEGDGDAEEREDTEVIEHTRPFGVPPEPSVPPMGDIAADQAPAEPADEAPADEGEVAAAAEGDAPAEEAEVVAADAEAVEAPSEEALPEDATSEEAASDEAASEDAPSDGETAEAPAEDAPAAWGAPESTEDAPSTEGWGFNAPVEAPVVESPSEPEAAEGGLSGEPAMWDLGGGGDAPAAAAPAEGEAAGTWNDGFGGSDAGAAVSEPEPWGFDFSAMDSVAPPEPDAEPEPEAAPEEPAAEDAATEDAPSEETGAEEAPAEEAVAEDAPAEEDAAAEEALPEEEAAEEEAPPEEGATVEEADTEDAVAAEEVPVEEADAEAAPAADGVTVEEADTDDAPAEDGVSVEEADTDDAPAEDGVTVEEADTDDAPAEDGVTVEEADTDDAPAEEEATSDDAPAEEEATSDDAPAEEEPTSDDATAEVTDAEDAAAGDTTAEEPEAAEAPAEEPGATEEAAAEEAPEVAEEAAAEEPEAAEAPASEEVGEEDVPVEAPAAEEAPAEEELAVEEPALEEPAVEEEPAADEAEAPEVDDAPGAEDDAEAAADPEEDSGDDAPADAADDDAEAAASSAPTLSPWSTLADVAPSSWTAAASEPAAEESTDDAGEEAPAEDAAEAPAEDAAEAPAEADSDGGDAEDASDEAEPSEGEPQSNDEAEATWFAASEEILPPAIEGDDGTVEVAEVADDEAVAAAEVVDVEPAVEAADADGAAEPAEADDDAETDDAETTAEDEVEDSAEEATDAEAPAEEGPPADEAATVSLASADDSWEFSGTPSADGAPGAPAEESWQDIDMSAPAEAAEDTSAPEGDGAADAGEDVAPPSEGVPAVEHLGEAKAPATSGPTLPQRLGEVDGDHPLRVPAGDGLQEAVDRVTGQLALSRDVVMRAVRNLLAGNHLVLSGHPGTGKSHLATLLAESVFGYRPIVVTATGEWTALDLVGGAISTEQGYELRYGHALDALLDNWNWDPRSGAWTRNDIEEGGPKGVWLVVDDLNRAPVDRAFGELFTALQLGKLRVPVVGSSGAVVTTEVPVPSDFRIIATVNSGDQGFVYALSEAIKRRFAFVEVDDAAPEREAEVLAQRTIDQLDAMQLDEGVNDGLRSSVSDDASRLVQLAALLRSFRPLGTASLLSTLNAAATSRALGAQDNGTLAIEDAAEDHLVRLFDEERPFRLRCLSHLLAADLDGLGAHLAADFEGTVADPIRLNDLKSCFRWLGELSSDVQPELDGLLDKVEGFAAQGEAEVDPEVVRVCADLLRSLLGRLPEPQLRFPKLSGRLKELAERESL